MCPPRVQAAPSSSPPLPPCGSAQDRGKWVLNPWLRVKEPTRQPPGRANQFVADTHDLAVSPDSGGAGKAPLRQRLLGCPPRPGVVDVDPARTRDEAVHRNVLCQEPRVRDAGEAVDLIRCHPREDRWLEDLKTREHEAPESPGRVGRDA